MWRHDYGLLDLSLSPVTPFGLLGRALDRVPEIYPAKEKLASKL